MSIQLNFSNFKSILSQENKRLIEGERPTLLCMKYKVNYHEN